uniref:Zf-AD domain-containing protein n=1 Tax=Syphacia muris TaxID=451379 RepID=A0A0N5A8V4_9BILA
MKNKQNRSTGIDLCQRCLDVVKLPEALETKKQRESAYLIKFVEEDQVAVLKNDASADRKQDNATKNEQKPVQNAVQSVEPNGNNVYR